MRSDCSVELGPRQAHFLLVEMVECAQVAEWLMAADCKSAAPCELRRFESSPVHQFFGIVIARLGCGQRRILVLDESFVGGVECVRDPGRSSVDHDQRAEISIGRGGDSGDVRRSHLVLAQKAAARTPRAPGRIKRVCDRELGGSNSVVESQPSKLRRLAGVLSLPPKSRAQSRDLLDGWS